MRKHAVFFEFYSDKILCQKGIRKLSDGKISLGWFRTANLHPEQETNRFIHDQILSGKPFLAGRFGANELSMMKTIEFDVKSKYEICTHMMSSNAGFFPEDTGAIKGFLPLMLDFCNECDVLGTWSQPFEGYFIREYMKKNVFLTTLKGLEPWVCPEEPWSAALKGKKVVVVHPFQETIESQYLRRTDIFPGTEILPDFDLRIVKAVQTVAGTQDFRFASWYEALEYMFAEVMKEEFDVAIIGCGAYGAPLAAKIKKAGKQAIHLGGATQLLFGIMGKRWDGSLNNMYGYVQALSNDAWTRPAISDKVSNAENVEFGCYW